MKSRGTSQCHRKGWITEVLVRQNVNQGTTTNEKHGPHNIRGGITCQLKDKQSQRHINDQHTPDLGRAHQNAEG